MIKRLKVRNFKSLRNIDVELGKFTVLIGPNNSGKSNLLDSLIFFTNSVATELGSVVNLRGGFDHIVFGGKGRKFEISVEFLLNEESSNYHLSVNKEGSVEEEMLIVGDRIAVESAKGKGKLLRSDGALQEWHGPTNNTALYAIGRNEGFPLIQDVHDYLSSWKLYQIITSEMRRTLPAQKSLDLVKSGANIAQVLISLHNERPKLFSLAEDLIKQGIPEIEELLTPLTENGQTHVAIREKGFERGFDYFQVSDGTLKLLAYITAIILPEPRLICFEEPENFIHAELLELMVELLKMSHVQIILSTHSPYFVNFVKPEDIRLVRKEEGETRVSKIEDPEKLQEALEEMGLGELWYSGELGGVP